MKNGEVNNYHESSSFIFWGNDFCVVYLPNIFAELFGTTSNGNGTA
ncbi:MAG: hypothetical protein LBJ00_12405 [Planctomycetaceae bacterium]|nr:hypothetical protein [Planctomycetaceae bacterium]